MATISADAPTLAALREQYPEYHVRPVGRLWMATRRDDDPLRAPTLIEDTLPALARALANPPARAARPFSTAVIR